jgi:mannose-6-phosphate isomerase-like protein (cupin superfamily)
VEALMGKRRVAWMVVAGVSLTASVAFLAGQGAGQTTYISQEKVGGCAKGGSLATAPDYRVQCSNRTGPGVVEVHLNETDVMYFIDGSATLVTGGKTLDGKSEKDPLQIRGTSIEGGESRQVSKGDVVVVPAGVPHWFKEVPKSVSYFVVKTIKLK